MLRKLNDKTLRFIDMHPCYTRIRIYSLKNPYWKVIQESINETGLLFMKGDNDYSLSAQKLFLKLKNQFCSNWINLFMEKIDGKKQSIHRDLDLAECAYSKDSIIAYKDNGDAIEGVHYSFSEVWVRDNILYHKNYTV